MPQGSIINPACILKWPCDTIGGRLLHRIMGVSPMGNGSPLRLAGTPTKSARNEAIMPEISMVQLSVDLDPHTD
jgi:hypothetical protein